MLGLSDGERISMMRSAVLTQSTRVTDGQIDGIGVAYTRYSIYAVARKKTLSSGAELARTARILSNKYPRGTPYHRDQDLGVKHDSI